MKNVISFENINCMKNSRTYNNKFACDYCVLYQPTRYDQKTGGYIYDYCQNYNIELQINIDLSIVPYEICPNYKKYKLFYKLKKL